MHCSQIIMPRKGYGYEEMLADISLLEEKYPEFETKEIGQSVAGRKIIAFRLGKGSKEIFYSASMHANEWINTILMMMYAEVYLKALSSSGCLGAYYVPDLFETISLWIVPMVNPDGVELVQKGIDQSSAYYYDVMKINQGSKNFSHWKANIRGVDLNDQFPAGWEIERARRDVPGPAPMNYPGESPLSEPEAKALAQFTYSHDFRLVIAWHTQGREIYWSYENMEPAEAEYIVYLFSQTSGYQPIRYVESNAGYKDWFIQEWRRPGFTVECGFGRNPLPIRQFKRIWTETFSMMVLGMII